MTFPSADSENVEYNVIISADEALATLLQLTQGINSFDERVKAVQDALLVLGAQGSESLDVLLQKVVELDQAFAGKAGTSAIFGAEGKAGWTAVSQGIGEVTDALYPLEAQAVNAGESFNGLMTNSKTMNETFGETAPEAEAAAGGINILNTALGVLEAMLIFNLVRAVSTFFTNAIAYANDYYQSILNITVAQDAMARQGVSTTNQQLLDIANQLEERWKVISNVDMVNAVSQAALVTQQYRLSADQLKEMVNQAAILVATGQAKDMATAIDDITRVLAGGTSAKWAADMGINLDAATIKAKALEMGLIGVNGQLSDQDKALAALQLIQDRVGSEQQKALEIQTSTVGASKELGAAWKNTLELVGQSYAPLLAALQNFLTLLLNLEQQWIKFYTGAWVTGISVVLAGMQAWVQAVTTLDLSWSNFFKNFETNFNRVSGFFNQQIATGGISTANTPVSPNAPALTEAVKPLTNTQMDAAAKYHDQLIKDTENFNQQMADLQAQYDLNVHKEIENYDKAVAQEKQNFQLKQIQAEEAYQQKIKELNDRYQIDLEDALRKRDALAVLKLMEKHQNELDTAKQQEQLRTQQEQQAEQVRLSQLKQNEQLRLHQLQEEYDLKLQEEAVSIGQEYRLNSDGITALYSLFKEYYGSDGVFAKVQNESYITMINQSTGFVQAMQRIINQYANTIGQMAGMVGGFNKDRTGAFPVMGAGDSSLGGGGRRYAQGGIALAQSATSAVFGEAGPELAMFLPLNGSTAGMSASGLGGMLGGSAQGAIQILLSLDPDLEAKIMNNTLNQAANVIVQTYGSR